MDALTLLEQDHQTVKKLMGEIEKTTERGVKTREELFTKAAQQGGARRSRGANGSVEDGGF